MVSLDQPVTSEAGLRLADVLSEPDDTDLTEARMALEPVVRRLPERDRRILYLRFFEDRTQAEIGRDLGVSQMQVSRLLTKLLDQLRAEIS
jgi:RNA polymerase sigma-B factor